MALALCRGGETPKRIHMSLSQRNLVKFKFTESSMDMVVIKWHSGLRKILQIYSMIFLHSRVENTRKL